MFFHFSWLPPEINSARIYSGAGSGSLHAAAAAWQRLAQDLQATASSFQSVIATLVYGQWAGAASMSMAAAAAPLTGWLTAAAEHAQLSCGHTQAAAAAYESAFATTVHPAAVAANRNLLTTLVNTNFLGQNAPAIATTESAYAEMWAQDVAAMVGYHTKAVTLASTLSPLSAPPTDLVGGTAAQPWFPPVNPPIIDPLGPLFNTVSGVLSDLPVSSVLSVAELGMYPVSFMMSPLMMAMSSARGASSGLGAAGLGSAASAAASSVVPIAGSAAPALTGLGGAAMPGSGMSAVMGQAHTLGAVSVPATWPGSLPSGLTSSAVQGLGSMPTPAAMAQPTESADGIPMMPIAPRGAGSTSATPSEVTARGGVGAAAPALATPHSVIPRAGIG